MEMKGLLTSVITLGVVIFLVVIMGIVTTSTRESIQTSETLTKVNETILARDGPGTNLANLPATGSILTLVSGTDLVYNASDASKKVNNAVIPLNYTFNTTYGKVTFYGNSSYNGSNVNITYGYTKRIATAAYNATVFGEESYNNISGKLPLLGTIIILSTIILVVIGIFVMRRRDDPV